MSRQPLQRGGQQVRRRAFRELLQRAIQQVPRLDVGAMAGKPGCDQRRPFGRADVGPGGRADHAAQRVGRFAGVCGSQHPAKRQRVAAQPIAGLRAQRRFARRFHGFRPQQPGQGGGAAAEHPGAFQGRGQTCGQRVLAQAPAGAFP